MEREDPESGQRRTLVLAKHAMPVVEPHVPPSRCRLSEAGRYQSVALAERLEASRLVLVVTSEEPKAPATGKIVAPRAGTGWTLASGPQ